ncbi:MAG TPA: tetratricopeptide repeat protein, partial [Nannocystaceae bacterium]|nr:tetratricopeptide repeat protein [Nannocystaceae bacterium]
AAAGRFAPLAQSIDVYASQWTLEWSKGCGDAAAAACLTTARGRLHQLVSFFRRAGPQVLVFGPDAIEQLRDPSECAALPVATPVVVDEAEKALVDRLADARLRYVAQPGADDIQELVAIADDAEAAGHEELGARALALAGERLGEQDRPKAAEAVLRRAATLAVASGQREVMVTPWGLLASTLADQGELEEAEQTLELARGSARNVEDPGVRAALAHNGGLVLSQLGRIDDAVASFEQAIALNTENFGAHHREVAVNRGALGNALRRAGRVDEARKQLELALVISREASGDLHPTTGDILRWLGQLCTITGDFDCADDAFVRARAVYEAGFGDAGNPTLDVLSDLAEVRRQQGRLDESLALFELIYERGKAHPETGSTALGEAAGNLAVIRATRGDWQGALELAQVSRETFAAALDDDDTHVVQADTILGTILRELGRLDDSLAALQRAHTVAQRVLPPRDRERVNATIELGHTHVARGEPEAAAKLAEEALAALADPPGPPPVIAEAEFLLARALGPSSPRARERARHALEVFAALGPGHAATTTQIREWLASAD